MKKGIIIGVSCVFVAVFALLTMSFQTTQKTSSSDCIYFQGNAYDDGECIASITLTSSCTFLFINKEERPHERLQGTYSMSGSGSMERGCSYRVTMYVDGEAVAYGTLGWPLQSDRVHFYLGDFDFI